MEVVGAGVVEVVGAGVVEVVGSGVVEVVGSGAGVVEEVGCGVVEEVVGCGVVEEVVVGVTQSVGLVDPTGDDLPAKQDTQVLAEDEPTTEEYFPMPH